MAPQLPSMKGTCWRVQVFSPAFSYLMVFVRASQKHHPDLFVAYKMINRLMGGWCDLPLSDPFFVGDET